MHWLKQSFKRILLAAMVITTMVACASQPNAPTPSSLQNSVQLSSNGDLYSDIMAEERQWAGLGSATVSLKNGLEIAYSEGGNHQAPVLVLVHGYYADRNSWNRVAHQLEKDFHLIIPDLPGHGDSNAHPDGNYTFPEMATVIMHFLDALNIKKYHLAGHSMGGGIAIQLSMFRYDQIESLILVDSAGIYQNNDSPIMKRIIAQENPMRVARTGDLSKLLEIAMSRPPFIPKQILRSLEQKQIANVNVYDEVMNDMLEAQRNLDPDYFKIALKVFEQPALLIWGEEDRIFDVAVTDELVKALPIPTVVTFPGIGHTPILEAPERTAAAIREFLLLL